MSSEASKLPHAEPGQRIGLFGGSFNPAHEGHRLVALQCLRRLELDAVWLLVSPGNPLKDQSELAPLATRVAQVTALMDDPRLKVTAFEAARKFRYSVETIAFLTETRPDLHFVWIMGSDSLLTIDRWRNWEDIFEAVPVAVYARPGATLRALSSKAATRFRAARIRESEAAGLPGHPAPCWTFLRGVMSTASSTAIRKSSSLTTG